MSRNSGELFFDLYLSSLREENSPTSFLAQGRLRGLTPAVGGQEMEGAPQRYRCERPRQVSGGICWEKYSSLAVLLVQQ